MRSRHWIGETHRFGSCVCIVAVLDACERSCWSERIECRVKTIHSLLPFIHFICCMLPFPHTDSCFVFFTSRLNSHSHLLAHLFVIILLLRFFFRIFFWLNLCHNCEVFSRIYACACASVRSHSRIVILIWYTFSEPESQSQRTKNDDETNHSVQHRNVNPDGREQNTTDKRKKINKINKFFEENVARWPHWIKN